MQSSEPTACRIRGCYLAVNQKGYCKSHGHPKPRALVRRKTSEHPLTVNAMNATLTIEPGGHYWAVYFRHPDEDSDFIGVYYTRQEARQAAKAYRDPCGMCHVWIGRSIHEDGLERCDNCGCH